MDELLTTTLSPALSHIIERPRLIERILEADARVVLFAAPAGYGKTTLAKQWSTRQTGPVVWHRTTRASGDVAALAVRIDDALDAAVPQPGRDPRRVAAIASVNPHPSPLSRAVLSTYAGLTDDVLLIVDEWEAADTAEADEFLGTLVEELKIRFLITSRTRPPWFTSRLKVYGEALEIGMDELAMTDEEARAVLADASAADPFVSRAEGWPAVLGLAAMTKRRRKNAPTALPDTLYDYLATELLHSASDELQEALVLLAAASASDMAVARMLLGRRTADLLSEAGVLGFLSVDATHDIRLHPLLRDVLIERLRASTDLQRREALARLEPLLMSERWDEAFSVGEASLDAGFITRALEAALEALLRAGRVETLRRWGALAKRTGVRAELVDYVESEVAWRDGAFGRALMVARRAASELTGDFAARSHIIAARAASLAGRTSDAIAHADTARELAQTPDTRATAVWIGFTSRIEDERADAAGDLLAELGELTPLTSTVMLRLAQGALSLGLLHGDLRRRLDEGPLGMTLLDSSVDPVVATSYLNKLADVLAAHGSYAEGLKAAELEESLASEFDLRFVAPHALINRGRALIGLRRFGLAQRVLHALERHVRAQPDPYVETYLGMLRSSLYLSTGDLARGCGAVMISPDRLAGKSLSGQYLALRAVALAAADDNGASQAASELALNCSCSVEVAALVSAARAIAALTDGREAEAARAVDDAVASAAWDGLVLSLRASPKLAEFVASHPTHQHQLIRIWEQSNDAALARRAGLPIPRSARRSKELSPRELEIHDLIAQGMTNEEIAHLLFISVSTAKVHVRHILEKLGVRSRVEAVRIWQSPVRDPD